MNLTYQYLHYFSFNNCSFLFIHIHNSSLTNIIYLFLFHHTPLTNFTVKMQAPKYWSWNKYKNKDYPCTKIPFIYRGGWPQWWRQLNCCYLLVLRSLRHNGTVANQSSVCTSRNQRCIKLLSCDINIGKSL